ncbi:MAG: hypothetical protein FWE28_05245 [Oscillospiraceae bacterium]|nr:hypothetical protein [Oscillospiraceae bacterium]
MFRENASPNKKQGQGMTTSLDPMLFMYECISIAHPTGGPTALDHWSFEYDYIRREGFGTSTEYKVQNRRHSALDLSRFLGAQPISRLFVSFWRSKKKARPAGHSKPLACAKKPSAATPNRNGQEPGRTGARPLQGGKRNTPN